MECLRGCHRGLFLYPPLDLVHFPPRPDPSEPTAPREFPLEPTPLHRIYAAGSLPFASHQPRIGRLVGSKPPNKLKPRRSSFCSRTFRRKLSKMVQTFLIS